MNDFRALWYRVLSVEYNIDASLKWLHDVYHIKKENDFS